MHSGGGDTPQRVPGSPIRTPPDQRSVDSSPGPIAASHVLHRLLVPRHPPCALNHLHTRPHKTGTHPYHYGRVCAPGPRPARHVRNTHQETTPQKSFRPTTHTTPHKE